MDIVTHGVMGVVIAAPFAANHPDAAAAFMMGSVLPDADALSRVGGKRNFLKCHQNLYALASDHCGHRRRRIRNLRLTGLSRLPDRRCPRTGNGFS